jgi:hypothetical protein
MQIIKRIIIGIVALFTFMVIAAVACCCCCCCCCIACVMKEDEGKRAKKNELRAKCYCVKCLMQTLHLTICNIYLQHRLGCRLAIVR